MLALVVAGLAQGGAGNASSASPVWTPPAFVVPTTMATTVTPAPTCERGFAACGTTGGVSVQVSNISRNYQPIVPTDVAAQASPEHGYHWLRLEVTVVVSEGEQEVEENQFSVTDSLGSETTSDLLSMYDHNCSDTAAWGVYGPGESFGPAPLCLLVAGPVDGPLTLAWSPNVSETGVVHVQLP